VILAVAVFLVAEEEIDEEVLVEVIAVETEIVA
jgi:hypothetical protein